MNTVRRDMKALTFGLALAIVAVARAQIFPPTVVKRAGYTLKARAYIDPTRFSNAKHNPPSRYDLQLFQPPHVPYRWDFVLPGSTFHRTETTASIGSPDYRFHRQTIIRATLRQFDTYEERITFKNLNLTPPRPAFGNSITSRTLSLPKDRSITTPSGITVTLPTQSYDAIPPFMAGNPNALFVRIEVRPNAQLVTVLPHSPLYRKHHRPISLQLGTQYLYGTAYYTHYLEDATPSYGRVALSVANLKTVMHLDELTFFVRQRTDLQTVPVSIRVPISKPT